MTETDFVLKLNRELDEKIKGTVHISHTEIHTFRVEVRFNRSSDKYIYDIYEACLYKYFEEDDTDTVVNHIIDRLKKLVLEHYFVGVV